MCKDSISYYAAHEMHEDLTSLNSIMKDECEEGTWKEG